MINPILISFSQFKYVKFHTAVSRKVVLQTGKSLRDDVERFMGKGTFYGCLSEPQGASSWVKETAQTRIRFFSFLVADSP